MPYPGFPTDMQPQITVALCLAEGTSMVTEGVWDNRFRYVDELRKMGANVQVDGQVAVFEGVEKLSPAPLRALDLRAGAAMVVAALMADGTSEIEEIGHIERGYENIVAEMNRRDIGMPVVAIGGITTDDITAIMATGVSGIAVSGTILRADDPVEKTQEIMRLLAIHERQMP